MRVLIIEDNTAIVQALRRGLRGSYLITTAYNGVQGLHHAEANEYAAIILDLSLPDMAGLMVCRQLRRERITTPILVLTGDGATTKKVELLDAGADDYLTKPFSLEELKARLRVVIRRGTRSIRSTKLAVGDLTLDTVTRCIERAGTPIRLRRKEFDLLEYMMHHAGAVVTRATIVDQIWEMSDGIWTNAVDVHIKYLRDKIDRPFAQPLITTVYGVGYKLELSKPVAAMSTKEGGEEDE
jgi:two-component system OmpR family response regulator